MKRILSAFVWLLIIHFVASRCANIASPTGGPRDTIPPVLIKSYPPTGTTDYKGQEFTLTFSEFVKADQIQQKLIITPRTENKYKVTAKKNTILIKFEEPFKDSTTYNLNFADAITDITENNPAENLSLAFSTGKYIDSLSVAGSIKELFTQKPAKGYLAGLYPYTDTLDFFTDQPIYFTTSNDSGEFAMNYIKDGIYKLLIFRDENRNITFDPETEPHGFIQDSIDLDSAILLSDPINTLLQDVKPIKFINARPTGPYIELKYSKQVDNYNLQPSYLANSITGESKEVIRIYQNERINIGDSIVIYSTAYDSLKNATVDTVKTAFITSNRKPAAFTLRLTSSNSYLTEDYALQIKFSKPIDRVDSTKFYLSLDSTFKEQVHPSFTPNANGTLWTIIPNIKREFLIDTITALQPKDTTEKTEQRRERPGQSAKRLPPILFNIDTAAFISVENDTSLFQQQRIELQESTSFGTVKLSINTNYLSFNIQFLNNKDEVVTSDWNSTQLVIPKIPPGEYKIRALIDTNNDGKWSAGNLLKDLPPEPIYIHPESTEVRENWELELAIEF
ncbi:MAG: Ig-like domain-containing protein [Bacteroidota bacterium]